MKPIRRRSDALRNDELILDAALELLRQKGPDRLSTLDVSRAAGLTTGAVYARYENNEEILVGLWEQRIAEPMRAFLQTSLGVLGSTEQRRESEASIAQTLLDPASPLRPGIGLLIASTRIAELAEIITPQIQEWFHELGITDDLTDVAALQKVSVLSFTLGCLHASSIGMLQPADWKVVESMAHHILDHPFRDDDHFHEPIVPPPIRIADDNANREALLNGTAQIIARGGIERASLQRISRAAGLNPSTLFYEYRTRDLLFADAAAKILHCLYEARRTPNINSTPLIASSDAPKYFADPRLIAFRTQSKMYGPAATNGWLAPQGRAARRLMLEFDLAAMTNMAIRSAYTLVDEQGTAHAAESLLADFSIPL
ncbi:MAG: TetR family transcriptional regulator, partial [Actinobacteria bacterium]|nr:TetR family transcriptional regulator [Actinomycetota bacterium]MTA69797.1 TetR family transcriptional regulator [Actinomycetota bacterium]